MMTKLIEQLLELTKRLVDPGYRDSISPDALLLEDKILDSFGIIQLVAQVEREFSISIMTEDLNSQNFGTISDIAALVKRYVGNER